MIKKILTIFILLMSLGALAYADLTTDNQAYYAGDDESQYEIFGATGTNDGMSFDGVNDYVLSESYPLDTTMDLSVEFKSSFSGSSRTIMARSSDSSNRQFQLYQRSSDNKIQMSFFNGGSTNVGTLESDIAYNDGNWHTVRIVQSGNNAEMFIDGISVDTDSTSGKVTDTQKNTIGAYHDGSGSYWLGEIGEVNINDKTYLLSSLNDSSSSGNFATGNNGVSYTNESKVGTGAFEFDGIDDYVLLPNSFDSALTNDFTMNAWVKINSEATSDTFQVITDFRGERNLIISYVEATNTLEARFIGGTDITLKSDPISLGQWYFLTIQKNGSTGNLYLDSSLNDSNSVSNPSASATSTRIGLNPSGNGALDGYIDEWSFYNRTLSQAEIAELYNSGNGFNPYTTSATGITFNSPTNNQWLNDTNFTLDVSFSQTINSNYSLNGGTNTTLGTNVNNATVNLSGIPNIFNNISVYTSDNQSNSITFGIDTEKPNISVIGNLTQNNFEVDFSTIFAITDNFSGVASCTLNATYLENVTNASQFDRFVDCDATETFSAAGLYRGVLTATDNAGNVEILEVNGTIQPFVYVNFLNSTAGEIGEYDYTLTSPNGVITTETNTTNPVSISPFTEGVLDLGNWTIEFQKLGYVTQTFTIEINEGSGGTTENYTITKSRININMRDKATGNLITTETFNAEFIATVGASANTSNGTLSVGNTFFLSEQYTVTLTSSNYLTEQLIFNFNNQEILGLDAYFSLKNDTSVGTVFIKVVDLGSKPVKNAIVRAQQWDSVTSSYITVTQSVTGEDGLASLNIILNDENYKFTATSGTSTGESITEIIDDSENGKTITIPLDSAAAIQNYLFQNLDYTITQSFNNVTNVTTVTFEWENTDGINQEVCINRYRTISGSESLQDDSCTTGSSGELIKAYFINSSYDVSIKGEVKVNGVYYTLKTFNYDPSTSPQSLLENLNIAPFVIPILFLIAIALGLYIENIYIGTFLLTLASGFSLLLVPSLTTGGITAFFFFIGWMTISAGVKPR